MINNRTDGKKATAMNMYAFRITKSDVKFSITKVLSGDNSVKISGTSPIDNTQAIYGVYIDKECRNKVGEITIGDDGTGSITLPDKQYYVNIAWLHPEDAIRQRERLKAERIAAREQCVEPVRDVQPMNNDVPDENIEPSNAP